jgi:hypothetical protein
MKPQEAVAGCLSPPETLRRRCGRTQRRSLWRTDAGEEGSKKGGVCRSRYATNNSNSRRYNSSAFAFGRPERQQATCENPSANQCAARRLERIGNVKRNSGCFSWYSTYLSRRQNRIGQELAPFASTKVASGSGSLFSRHFCINLEKLSHRKRGVPC